MVPTPKILPKSDRAIKYHEEVFLPSITKKLERIQAIPLSILIWGPGSGNELFTERVKILNKLRDNGDLNANMSEELIKQDSKANTSLKTEEYLQASESDLIIILCCSPGSFAELHDFANSKRIARKMVIFVEQNVKNSYSHRGAIKDFANLYGSVKYFKNPEDFKNQKIMNKVLQVVLSFQTAKYMAIENARDWGIN